MLNHKGTQEIKTDRLLLRRFTSKDIEDAFNNWASDEDVTRYLTWCAYKDISGEAEYINQQIAKYVNNDFYAWAIEFEGQTIGTIDAHPVENLAIASIGYCMGKKWWGKGIMTEALKAVIDYLFSCGFIRIFAIHDISNPASGGVMQKAGMEFEGIIRKGGKDNRGNLVDVKQYSIINDTN